LFSEPCGTVAADIWTSAITPWADVETDVTSEAFADIDVLVVGKSVLSVDRGVVVTTPSKDGIWKEKDIEEVIPKLRELKAWKARNKLRR
jgi:hypothetical protein